jgi:hypothetical protein
MTTYRFAFVIDGEFAASASVSENALDPEGMLAVFRSNPTVIELPQGHPNFDEIGRGWTFDGTSWSPPVAE